MFRVVEVTSDEILQVTSDEIFVELAPRHFVLAVKLSRNKHYKLC